MYTERTEHASSVYTLHSLIKLFCDLYQHCANRSVNKKLKASLHRAFGTQKGLSLNW